MDEYVNTREAMTGGKDSSGSCDEPYETMDLPLSPPSTFVNIDGNGVGCVFSKTGGHIQSADDHYVNTGALVPEENILELATEPWAIAPETIDELVKGDIDQSTVCMVGSAGEANVDIEKTFRRGNLLVEQSANNELRNFAFKAERDRSASFAVTFRTSLRKLVLVACFLVSVFAIGLAGIALHKGSPTSTDCPLRPESGIAVSVDMPMKTRTFMDKESSGKR